MMPSNGKKQRLPSCHVLSDLPESVIDDILARLPLRDVVRTSILSKKWRYNWCRLPHLLLDQTLWKTTADLLSPTIGFTSILYHLLALHTGPITKLTLDIPHLKTCPNIDQLIYFLFRNDIQHIVLKPPRGPHQYKLPSSFFTSSGLKHLTLGKCLIHPQPVFKVFERIISLELSEVTISSELLGSLISQSPLLEHLVLEHDEYADHIEISAPKLRSFVFIGNINSLHLNYVPLLVEVSYGPSAFSVEAERDISKIFESIPALENLCWYHDYVQDMEIGPAEVIPRRLPSSLNCLKRLNISWIALEEYFDLSFTLCLIRSSPNLEEIEIVVLIIRDDNYFVPVPRDVVDEIPGSFSDMTFNHLRTVKINNIVGEGAEMQLIKVLLAKSPELVKMVIKPWRIEDRKSLKLLAEITNFQRSSSKAQVVYNID